MSRSLLIFCFSLASLLASWARAADEALTDARELLLTGKYGEAEDAYAALTKQHPTTAAIGKARAQLSAGKREDAEKGLREAIKADAKSAALRIELAQSLLERGEIDEAARLVVEALKSDSKLIHAHWLLAEIHQSRGKLQEAEREYKAIIDLANAADDLDVDAQLCAGRAAAQYARWKRNSGQFRVLVNETYPAILEEDENSWQAHLETALLFLEKYNEGEAANEVSAGLKINPNAAELHVVRAALALQKFDVKSAGASLDRALAINPNLLSAHQLKADLLIADQQAEAALAKLEDARKLNPIDEETLGRIAACYLVIDGPAADAKTSRAEKLIAETIARNEHCGRFFATLADTFDLMRKYPQAAKYYIEAQTRMPQLIFVRGRLGLVQMRLGEEVAAAKLLDESFKEDPFNVRVKNMLEVLDVLQGYAVLETDHFVIKFDRGKDEVLAKYAAKYLEEEVYPEIVKTLGYAPEGKSLFEIFNRAKNTRGHSWFSARMVGLPFIGTVGACGGKIVAVASPGDMPQKFHWGRVLKHEFVHVVNLQQTDFNIPHWFTEGIAVRLEDLPRPTSWNEILATRLASDKLFNLSDINYGFIRPANQNDWTLAYCQAELYCEYLVKTYGDDALAKMLAAYKQNLTTEAALRREFQVAIKDFEKGYKEYVAAEVKKSGSAVNEKQAERTIVELEAAIAKTPEDAALQADLALAQFSASNLPAARKAAEAARKLQPKQPLAAYVLARIQTSIGDTGAAQKILNEVHDQQQPNERVVALLATIELQQEDYAAAEALFKLGAKHFAPRDKWLKSLAKVYLKTGEEQPLADVLGELAELDYDNVTMRKKLSQLAKGREDWPAAARWAKDALFIDINDAELHAQLAEALLNQKQFQPAIEEYNAAIHLNPDLPQWRMALADAYLAVGNKAEAKATLQKLLEVAPKFPGADLMLEQLNQ